jgi:hypothetical protein
MYNEIISMGWISGKFTSDKSLPDPASLVWLSLFSSDRRQICLTAHDLLTVCLSVLDKIVESEKQYSTS